MQIADQFRFNSSAQILSLLFTDLGISVDAKSGSINTRRDGYNANLATEYALLLKNIYIIIIPEPRMSEH